MAHEAGPRRLLLFTGEGKGKTTAALGMVLRACGHGQRVLVVQFIKAESSTGEMAAMSLLPGVRMIQTGLGFVPSCTSARFAAHQAAARGGLAEVAQAFRTNEHDLFVLDEVCNAVAKGLLAEAEILALLEGAPPASCVVLTGRGATEPLIARADTVTEMRCVKHAHTQGTPAEKGVEC